jgi:NAD(P)-dependent dehydrogenase (short-subunit alcohol dehydrogenase family)
VILSSIPAGGVAVVVGASGGIGNALASLLEDSGQFGKVVRLHRTSDPALDIEDEKTIERVASSLKSLGDLRLVVNATGYLHGGGGEPEKTWRNLDPAHMAKSFAVNAIGPALLMKHLLPQLSRPGKSVFATLSAKVGSIGDNRLGGWYSYRASKAALNQLVRTAAIELSRSKPEAICVALHPGTVATPLSAPFAKSGLDVQTPTQAATAILSCIDGLASPQTGGFFDNKGNRLPW